MDEPTNGLDIPGKSQFRKFLASGMSDDKTIVISTHQVRDIDKVLDLSLIHIFIGMIRSFAALAAGGSADSMALSQGISEALINTAFGDVYKRQAL